MFETTQLNLLQSIRSSPGNKGWEVFVEIYQPYIKHCLSRLELCEQDTADICQEVMQVVVREIGQYEHSGRKGAFRSWLRMVVANRLRSFQRTQARQPRSLDGSSFLELAEQLEDDNHRLSRLWDEEHNRHVIKGFLRTISSRHQPNTMLAFERLFLNEEPADRVAKDLGMTVNAVRIAQARVLRSLRELGEGLIE